MSYATITNRISDIMQRVESVYNIHTYLRDVPDESQFEAAFKITVGDKTLLTAWMMTRTGIQTVRPTVDVTNMYDVTHKIELQGFYGLSDAEASERTFQQIIDNLYGKFRAKYLLENEAGVALSGIVMVDPLQTLEIGHGQFSNYFVHFVRMLLSVRERLP